MVKYAFAIILMLSFFYILIIGGTRNLILFKLLNATQRTFFPEILEKYLVHIFYFFSVEELSS